MAVHSTSRPPTHADSRRQKALPPPVWVDNSAQLREMLGNLATEPVIAVDTESDSLYRYNYKVCLIQISSTHADYLVDPLRLKELAGLGSIFADPGIEKVFHAAENDILLLKRDFSLEFACIFDTMLAARILGWSRVSLAGLLGDRFGVEMDKRAQLTDWGRRPLAHEQLRYAQLDTHYLLPLRDLMETELRSKARWAEAQEAFATLPAVTYVEKPFDPNGFWRSRGARDLEPKELAVLRELYLWREQCARSQNCPPFKILNDQSLVRLSREQPAHIADLPLSAGQRKHYGTAVLAAIARGRSASPPQVPSREHNNHRPDPDSLARFDKLRAWRSQRATDRGVDADIVLTNETLMAIARAAPKDLAHLAALGVMGSWKLQEYGNEVLSVLAAAP